MSDSGTNSSSAIVLTFTIFAIATFTGSTFGTLPIVLAAIAVASFIVLLRMIASRRNQFAVQRVTRIDSAAAIQPPKSRLTNESAANRTTEDSGNGTQTFAKFVFVTLAMIVTLFWRQDANQGLEDSLSLKSAVDLFAHANAIALLAVWCVFPRRGHVSVLSFGMLTVLACVAGGGVSRSIASQSMIGILTCVGFALAASCVLIPNSLSRWYFGASHAPDQDMAIVQGRRTKAHLLTPAMSLLTIGLLILTTLVMTQATNAVMPAITDLLRKRIPDSFEDTGVLVKFGGNQYVRGGTIGSVRRVMMEDPDSIALSVYSGAPPGYLRGTVLDSYAHSRWASSAARRQRRRVNIFNRRIRGAGKIRYEDMHVNNVGFRHFDISLPNQDTVALEIHTFPEKGQMVFSPMTVAWMEASADEISVSDTNLISGDGVDLAQPYVVGAHTRTAPELLSERERHSYLRVPPDLYEFLRDYQSQLAIDDLSPIEKAEAISRHFQNTFEYALEVPRPISNADPMEYFLTTRHPAYCEYFATATGLLLRSAGVPTRYVTGYVTVEPTDDGTYWLARNRDAHAWIEAYDDRSERWFAVESTPGRSYQTVQRSNAALDTTDLDFLLGDDASLIQNKSWWRRLIDWVSSDRVTDSFATGLRYAQLPFICVIGVGMWYRYKKTVRVVVDRADRISWRRLAKIEKRLRRTYGLSRQRTETLHHFADRVENASFGQSQTRKVNTGPTALSAGNEPTALAAGLTGETLAVSTPAASAVGSHDIPSSPSQAQTDENDTSKNDRQKLAGWLREYAEARYQGNLPPTFDQ